MESRKCSKCQIIKPIEKFTRDSSKKSGYKSQCKDCIASNPKRQAYLKNYRLNHLDYYKEKHAEYRSRNREKLKEVSKTRRLTNPDSTRIYYQKNRERILEYARNYTHSERGIEIRRAYRCTEKYKANKINNRMKRRAKVAIGNTDITLEKLYNRSGGICAICGNVCDYSDYRIDNNIFIAGNNYPSIDHIKPLSKRGSHTWDNIQLAHKRCNSIKSDKL